MDILKVPAAAAPSRDTSYVAEKKATPTTAVADVPLAAAAVAQKTWVATTNVSDAGIS
jgi:hypothetical protein